MIRNGASLECLSLYSDTSRHLELLVQDSEDEMVSIEEKKRGKKEMNSNDEKEIEMRKNRPLLRAVGNEQPFGGTNQLARASLLGSCIITALVCVWYFSECSI